MIVPRGADFATTPVVYNFHADHLNRPIAMTDGCKAEVWRADFLPFGAVSSITGTASLDMQFPGQWFQLEAGFHSLRHTYASELLQNGGTLSTLARQLGHASGKHRSPDLWSPHEQQHPG